MNWIKKYNWRKTIALSIWLLIGLGVLVLLAAAVRSTKDRRCTGLEISISGSGKSLFIDEAEVRRILAEHVGDRVQGLSVSRFNLHAIEKAIRQDIWIKDASLFFNSDGVLKIKVKEREPVARIFSRNGGSFYVDSSLMILPLSNLFSAKLPVFTGFPTDHRVLIKRDSLLLRQVCNLGIFILEDSLRMAMIEQVDITPAGEFELIPKVGNLVVAFGDGSDLEGKFNRMMLFYKKVLLKGNLNRYGKISLKYDGQVVASQKGKEEAVADSVRTLELLKLIALESERKAGDSSQRFSQDYDRISADSSLIRAPMEREPLSESVASSSAAAAMKTKDTKTAGAAKPAAVKPTANKPVAPVKKLVKPAAKPKSNSKPKKEEKKPKAVMNKSNNKNKN
jgi:cell division protein FtsQ